MTTIRSRLAAWTLGTLLSAALWPLGSFAFAFANVDVGETVENEELPGLEGGKKPLLQKGKVGVFVFFRPNQDHSEDTLTRLAEIEKEFAGKPVWFTAVGSDSWPAEEGEALVKRACTSCHAIDRVNNARYAPERWRVVTVDMRERGAKLEDDELERLVEWLGRVKGTNDSDRQ